MPLRFLCGAATLIELTPPAKHFWPALTRLKDPAEFMTQERNTPAAQRQWLRHFSLLQTGSLLVSVLIALPILFIVASLFTPATESWTHIRSTVLNTYIVNTALLMLQVACYTLIIGVGCAWLTAALSFPGQRFFNWALMLPLAAPAYIVAYVYTDLLEYSGPVQTALRTYFDWQNGDYFFPSIRSLSGAALVISLVLYPYVYLLARVAFSQRSATLFDAARTLGASPYRTFFTVALPAARAAIVGGVALVLMETLADFGVVDYFGVPTFSTGIFRTWFALGDKAAAVKLAAVMFIFVLVLVALEKSQRGKTSAQAIASDARFKRIPLSGPKAWLAFLACFLPVTLGFVVPFSVLSYYAVSVGDPLLGKRFLDFMLNSVQLSSVATMVTTLAALLLAYTVHKQSSLVTRFSVSIGTLGYALPGAMLAIGLLTAVSGFDRQLAEFFEQRFGWRSGLLLTGTTFILIYAYLVRFLTVAFNTTNSGFKHIPPVYDHVAQSLGAKRPRILRRIYYPLMKRSIATALILVFVDTMRELPATLLLRPFNFETLATRVYRLASDERIAEASTAAIAIVIIGLIPVLFLNKLSEKTQP